MTTILVALLFFSIFIMIHELGHFLVAKAVGIHAEEFSIGMGPQTIKNTPKNGILFSSIAYRRLCSFSGRR